MKDEGGLATAPAAAATRLSPILVVGLGNPILGDDGAGWRVAEAVEAAIQPHAGKVEVDYASLGGLSLMERILGRRRVILVDTVQSGDFEEGSVKTYPLDELPDVSAGHTSSPHDASLLTALKAARLMGAAVPDRVDVVVIEARNCVDFSEQLTPPIAAAVTIATGMVLDLLEQDSG